MSGWHREHPELTGTSSDPWMVNESYRRIVDPPDRPCADGEPALDPDDGQDLDAEDQP